MLRRMQAAKKDTVRSFHGISQYAVEIRNRSFLHSGPQRGGNRRHWAFSSIYNEGEYSDNLAMDTATYAAVAALPWNVVQGIHPVGPEAEFVPFNLSYLSSLWIRLFQATGPCNDL